MAYRMTYSLNSRLYKLSKVECFVNVLIILQKGRLQKAKTVLTVTLFPTAVVFNDQKKEWKFFSIELYGPFIGK